MIKRKTKLNQTNKSHRVSKTLEDIHDAFKNLFKSKKRISSSKIIDGSQLGEIHFPPLFMINKEPEVILPINAMSSLNLDCNNESKCSSFLEQEYSYIPESTDLHFLNSGKTNTEKTRKINLTGMTEFRLKYDSIEEVSEKSSNFEELNLIDQSYMIDSFKDQSVLTIQENTVDPNWFNKYLIPGHIIYNSPEKVPSNISDSMSRVEIKKESPIHYKYLNHKPTPFVKFCMEHRAKKLHKRTKQESLNKRKEFGGLLNSVFNFENLDSDV